MKRQAKSISPEDVGFKRFWAVWPKRVAKKDALKAWGQINPTAAVVDKMIATLTWQIPNWALDGYRYTPYPATWLRGYRWDDEPIVPMPDARGHFPPCRTNTECNRKLEQEIEARKAGATV